MLSLTFSSVYKS